MDEKEPIAHFRFGDEEVDATADNTEVYTHNPKIVDALGSLATRDHVFCRFSETSGVYVWRHHPSFEEIVRRALEEGVATHVNLRHVAECDQAAFDRAAYSDLDGGVPEEWL